MEVLHTHPDNIIVEGRARKLFNGLEELADSIKQHGLIHPIRVTADLKLVAGERRLRACKIAGVDVDYIIKEDCSAVELKELELRENLDRADMTWQEKDFAIAELNALKQSVHGVAEAGRGSSGWSATDTAALINAKSNTTVLQAVNMAAAMKAFPELAASKSHHEAQKKLNKITEKLAIAELAKRKKAGATGQSVLADEHFIVGDAFEGLKRLPAESVNFCNVDTPYGIDLTTNKKIQSESRTDDDYCEWAKDVYVENIQLVATECFRALKNNSWMIFWLGQEWLYQARIVLESVGFKIDKIPAIWYGGAGGAQTMATETNLARCYETFYVCRKGDPILLKRGRINVFSFDKIAPQIKYHPTQKPLELMTEIYDTFVMPGHIILSPFLGSGVDIRAAYLHGCHAFGFDLNQYTKDRFLLQVEQDIKDGLYGKGV